MTEIENGSLIEKKDIQGPMLMQTETKEETLAILNSEEKILKILNYLKTIDDLTLEIERTLSLEVYEFTELESKILLNYILKIDWEHKNIDLGDLMNLFDKSSLNISEEDFVNIYIENGFENIITIHLDEFENRDEILEKLLKKDFIQTIKYILEDKDEVLIEFFSKYIKEKNLINKIFDTFLESKYFYLILKNLEVFGNQLEKFKYLILKNFEKVSSTLDEKNFLYLDSITRKKDEDDDLNLDYEIITYYINYLFDHNKIDNIENIVKSIYFINSDNKELVQKKIKELLNSDKKDLVKKYLFELIELKKMMTVYFKENENFNDEDFNNEDFINYFVGKAIKKLNSIYLKDINNLEEEISENKKELIIPSIVFEEFKNDHFNDIYLLEKLGFTLDKVESNHLTKQEKIEKKEKFMELYNQNYKDKKFLGEIEQGLEKTFTKKDTIIFLVSYKGKTLFSSYLEKIEDGKVYWGAFNTSLDFSYYGFGKWFLDQILHKISTINDIHCTVTKEINKVENSRYKSLLKIYKKYGFKITGEGENKNSKFIKLEKQRIDAFFPRMFYDLTGMERPIM